jgi:hypothetical protein
MSSYADFEDQRAKLTRKVIFEKYYPPKKEEKYYPNIDFDYDYSIPDNFT